MIKIILNFINIFIYKILNKLFIFRTFSQEGEDLIINRLYKFKNNKKKKFLDIGAGHPIKYSNTFLLYIKGIRGVSIDANTKNIFLHKIFRPMDISKKFLISRKTTKKIFYEYNDSELNTTSLKKVNYLKKKKISYKSKKIYNSIGVNDFFNNELKDIISEIEFFNLDVEGIEFEIINEINWKKFKPKIVCIEITNFDFKNLKKNKIYKKLVKNGYTLKSKLYNSIIFTKHE